MPVRKPKTQHSELAAVLHPPAPFDAEQSQHELSDQFLERLFDKHVAENSSAAVDNMQEERISENIINQWNGAVKNVTDNPIILPAITQAVSQIQSQSSNK